jgi:hypothetical protein
MTEVPVDPPSDEELAPQEPELNGIAATVSMSEIR